MLVRQFTPSKTLELKAAAFPQFVEDVLAADLTAAKAPESFPGLPDELAATKELGEALAALPALFNKIHPTTRRAFDAKELEAVGAELVAIRDVLDVLGQREEDIKEFFRTHQDVHAEQQGRAFPHDVVRNGNLLHKATPRDAKGHYLLAKPQEPEVTKIPNTVVEISNQYTSGKLATNFEALTLLHEQGGLDRKTYLAISTAKRVVDPEKLRAYTIQSGDASLLAHISKRGLPSSSLTVRGLTKLPKKVTAKKK